MRQVRTKILPRLLMFILCVAIVSACSKSTPSAQSATDAPQGTAAATAAAATAAAATATPDAASLKPVKLIWYYPASADQPDQKLVNDAVNKYLTEKINATVDLRPINFSDYDTKMNATMASREAFDLAFATRGWILQYQPNIDKGAFLQLSDDFIHKYAAQARANIPNKFWPDMEANDGKVYGFPVYQIAARQDGFYVQKKYADKYHLDPSTIKQCEDIEPFLKQIKDNEPGITPIAMAQNAEGCFSDPKVATYQGTPVEHMKGDPTYKMLNAFQKLDLRKGYYDTLHRWYTLGYINQDAPILKDVSTLIQTGKVAVQLDWTSAPGYEAIIQTKNGGNPVVDVPFGDTVFTGISAGMDVISKTSKNPERAMMLINLLNTDKYLYNLMCFGIEGKHYTKVDDKHITQIKASGYLPNTDWVFGDQFNAYLIPGRPDDVWQQTIDKNNGAVVPASYGFSVNTDSIKAEGTNTFATVNEYYTALETGSVDPKVELPKYEQKLKGAGQEKIDAETEKQWNEFLKKKGLIK